MTDRNPNRTLFESLRKGLLEAYQDGDKGPGTHLRARAIKAIQFAYQEVAADIPEGSYASDVLDTVFDYLPDPEVARYLSTLTGGALDELADDALGPYGLKTAFDGN
jgi:hypothetical protein